METKRKIKTSPGEKAFNVFNYVILGILALLCLYPMLYVAFASLSDSNLLTQHSGLLLWPQGFSLAAYERVFSNPMIVKGYLNTLFVLGVSLLFQLTMTSLGAYVLSRKSLMLRKPLMMFITVTMFFSGGMIPFYLNLQSLGLTRTLWGLIIPLPITKPACIGKRVLCFNHFIKGKAALFLCIIVRWISKQDTQIVPAAIEYPVYIDIAAMETVENHVISTDKKTVVADFVGNSG